MRGSRVNRNKLGHPDRLQITRNIRFSIGNYYTEFIVGKYEVTVCKEIRVHCTFDIAYKHNKYTFL